MAKSKTKTDRVYDKAIRKAIKTGFLFNLSINFYENHTREELLEKGYHEAQIECANTVLAHFDTGIGAKLGRCPEELWSLRACVECGATVDTREVNSFPWYGVFLCGPCTDQRNSQRKCFNCGNRTDDPAEEFPRVNKKYVGKDLERKERYEYVCSWCALPLGYSDFLRKRGGTDREYEDLNTLIEQLSLLRKGEPHGFPTAEKLDQLRKEVMHFDWYFDSQLGLDFGERWKDYHISYTGILWATLKEPPGPDFNPFPFTGLLIKDKKEPRKLYWICRVRIRYKESLVFLEIRDGHRLKAEIEIKNIQPGFKDAEINKLWEGRKLFFKIEEKYGRPSSLPKHWQDIFEDYGYIRAIYQYQQWGEPGQKGIADFYGVNRTNLYRHCKNKLRKPWREILSETERVAGPMALEDIPERYLRFYSIDK